MKKVKINVTKEDIKTGLRNNCDKCPVALAIVRKFKSELVFVGHRAWYAIDGKGNKVGGDLPIKAQEFIVKFDRGAFVSPFTFMVEAR